VSVGALTIGLWSDMDGLDVHAAFCVLEMDGLPLRYLDQWRNPGPVRTKAWKVQTLIVRVAKLVFTKGL
jgi:hypothetical protein